LLPAPAEPVERTPVARRPKHSLPAGYWTIWTTVALDLIGFGIVVPILGRYAERFGASGLEVGLLFASFSLAQFISAPLLGKLSDRIGRKPVIIISLVGTAFGSVLTGAANTLWLLFAGRIIDGASGGSLSVAQAAVADIAPAHQRERLIGGLSAAFGVGFVLGPALGGLAALRGPHVPFYVAAALAAINAVAALVRLPETRTPGVHAHEERHIPRSPVLRRLAFIGFVTTVAFVGFEATFSLFGERRFSIDEAGTSVIFLCIGVLLVAIQGGGYGRIVARLGLSRVYAIGLGSMALGLLSLALATSWAVLVIALFLLTCGQGLASPSVTSLVARVAPEHGRGQALGFQQSATAVGRVVGPPAAGAAFDHVGVWSPYVAGAVLCTGGLVAGVAWRLFNEVEMEP
jgi:MFS transporter, DHA1 family, tetracycline resistance protein